MNLRGMDRGKQQVMFSYLPDSTFDYEGGSVICRVTYLDGARISLESEDLLRREIRSYVLGTSSNPRWDQIHVVRFSDPVARPGDFELIDPQSVRYDLFPPVWQCPRCRRVYAYQDAARAAEQNPRLTCRTCEGDVALRQVYHVFVHECGAIEPAAPPWRCPKHPHSALVLDDRRSQQARDFRWLCPECGDRPVAPFIRRCPTCASASLDAGMSPLPHRAGPAYYPHYVRLIDVRAPIPSDVDLEHARKVVARLTGSLETDDGLAHLRRALAGNLAPEVRRQLEGILAAAEGAGAPSISGTFQPEMLRGADSYLNVVDHLKVHGVDELAAQLDATKAGLGDALRQAPSVLRLWGVEQTLLVENFPVVTAVFGYTRNAYEPRSTREGKEVLSTFRGFPSRPRESRHPVYVDRGEAEAILLRLDPCAVIRWLAAGGIADTPDPSDRQACQVWLLRHVGEVGRIVRIPDADRITSRVFGLVHTMSHTLARSVALLGGFERSGVAEYLFPSVPAIVLFSNRTDFSVGGLWTLFEEHLGAVFTRTMDYESVACVYDPVCLEHGGSCHACLHLPEISCAHLNSSLSRVYLFGGKLGDEHIPGFWEGVRVDG